MDDDDGGDDGIPGNRHQVSMTPGCDRGDHKGPRSLFFIFLDEFCLSYDTLLF